MRHAAGGVRRAVAVLLTLLILTLLPGAETAIAETDVRQYEVGRDGQRFGEITIHRDSTPVELNIFNDQRITFRLLGVTQEMQEKVDFHLDRRSGDRRVLLVSHSPLRTATVEVTLSGNQAWVKELPQGRSTQLDAKVPLWLELDYILDHGISRFEVGETHRFLAVDPENFRLETVSVRLLEYIPDLVPGGAWRFEIARSVLVSQETYDRDLNLLSGRIPALGLEINPLSAHGVMEVFELAGEDLLEFPWLIETCETILAAEIAFSVCGIDAQELDLEDAAQRVMSINGVTIRDVSVMGMNTLEIRVQLQNVDLSSEFDVPMSLAQVETDSVYLLETAMIRMQSPETERLLREILPPGDLKTMAGQKTLHQLVEILVTRLNQRIRQEAVADRMNSDEILRSGRGMCMHFATVFAAAMRRLGVPTRCVMGEIHVSDRFLPHMYNDVWNGRRWLPVDSVQPRFRPETNPLLLRLSSGRDLSDLAALKARLIRKMKIRDVMITRRKP